MECSQSRSSFQGALNFEHRYLRRVVKVYNVSNPAISRNVRRLAAEKESRRSEWQIREVRRSRFPGGWPVSSMHFTSYDMRRDEQERGKTLRPLAHALSFVILRPSLSSADPSRQSPSPPLRLTRLLRVSIFTTLLEDRSDMGERTSGTSRKGNGDNRRAKIARSDDYGTKNFFFFYVCFLSTHLAFSPSAFLFFFFHAKAPRLISRARMTLRGQVVGDSEVLPAESLLVHGMYSA